MTGVDTCLARLRDLADRMDRPVRIMEVCGTHTMAAFRTGLRSLLPENVSLLSGPGCPVCVTPNGYMDMAVELAECPDAVVTTFGDMVRVPGSRSSLERARAGGADVRVVYSPLDALEAAKQNPGRRIVFLGVGFETTTPTVAWTIREAARTGIENYSVLCAHKTIPEAMEAILESEDVRIDGFMCPGHVSVIIGSGAYESLCRRHGIPCVVAGFEAVDMARAMEMLLLQRVEGRAEVEIEYSRSVSVEGNPEARDVCSEVFEKSDTEWRGIGVIPGSGLKIRDSFRTHDALEMFADVEVEPPVRPTGCICGDVLRGSRTPADCPQFGRSCTPTSPIGPCMVSSEGTCAAHFKYGGRR
ncbi:MAG: hydrogenase formation protein HypD [Lentisphaerae bacterium]|nr:hydrogenase formation protein HypD [Lentisphaerota bacterium]